jgi:hypothetical protein
VAAAAAAAPAAAPASTSKHGRVCFNFPVCDR